MMFGGSYLHKGWHLLAILGGGGRRKGWRKSYICKNQFCVCVCESVRLHTCVGECIFVQ